MRIVAVLLIVIATILPAAAVDPSPEQLFQEFGLFGTWASNCSASASLANPHVKISQPSPGLILEEDHLGADYTVNHYSVLSAERLSATLLSVVVLFRPGTEDEEREKLIFMIRDHSRRTMFNQVEGGPVRVKDGITLGRGIKTPLLYKCK